MTGLLFYKEARLLVKKVEQEAIAVLKQSWRKNYKHKTLQEIAEDWGKTQKWVKDFVREHDLPTRTEKQ